MKKRDPSSCVLEPSNSIPAFVIELFQVRFGPNFTSASCPSRAASSAYPNKATAHKAVTAYDAFDQREPSDSFSLGSSGFLADRAILVSTTRIP